MTITYLAFKSLGDRIALPKKVVKEIKKSPWKVGTERLNNLPDSRANQGQSSSYNSVFPISKPLLTVKAH